jgi:hypothetical protein
MLGITYLVNPDRALLWGIVPTIIGIVSVGGVFCILRETQKISKRWYFGIPHAIVLILVCLTGPFVFISGGRNLEYLYISLALLSITSTGLFLSFLDPKQTVTRVFMLVPGVIGIYAIVSSYFVILGIMSPLRTSWSVITAFEGIYLIFLMPLIGICYVAVAYVRESSLPAGKT